MAIRCEHCGRYWPTGHKGWRCPYSGKGMQSGWAAREGTTDDF